MVKNPGIYFLLFFSFLNYSISKSQNIDSLKMALQNAKHDTTKLTVLFALVEGISDDNVWPLYNEQALKLSEKLCQSTNELINKKGKKGQADALNNIGYNYCNQGDIPKALDYFERCLKLQKELGDKQGTATTINNIGAVYNSQGDIIKALEYWNKSLKIQEEIGDKMGLSNSLNNIGIIYENYPGVGELGLTKALEYYKKSLKIREEIGFKLGIAIAYNNIGLVCYKQNNIPLSLDFYRKSLQMRKELEDKNGIANSLNNIGVAYFKLKKHQLAFAYCDSSLLVSKELGFPEAISSAETALSRIDSARGNFLGAFEHYRQYIFYSDSTNNEQNRKASYRSQLKYDYEKKELVLKEIQEKERMVAEEKSRFQVVIIWAVVAGMILVIIFSVFIFRSLQRNKITNKIIEEKQREILDSIHYAKKIQSALIPSEKYIDKELKRLKV